MSYNIDTCKIKKIKDFKIPITALYDQDKIRKDWLPRKPEIIDFEHNIVHIDLGCEQEIIGILNDGILQITDIDLSGEGSGSLRHMVLDDAFKKSSGEFEAVLIWEGGDSVTRLSIIDGNINEEDIEL